MYKYYTKVVCLLGSALLGSSNNQRKKSSKKRSGHHTLRLRHGIPVDPDEVVENLLNDPDQVDGGPTTQVDNIRDLTTTITNKKLIRYQIIRSYESLQITYFIIDAFVDY